MFAAPPGSSSAQQQQPIVSTSSSTAHSPVSGAGHDAGAVNSAARLQPIITESPFGGFRVDWNQMERDEKMKDWVSGDWIL